MFNLEFLSECMKSDKDITVVILPSGQTGKLQPMDLKVYGPVKKYRRDYLRLMTLIAEEEVNKQNFARHLVKKWDEFNMAANIISGFAFSGIYPFNPDAVCRAYVEPVPSQFLSDVPISVATVYVSELEVIRTNLRKIPLLTEGQIEEIVAFTISKAEGFLPSVAADKVAADWHHNFMSAHPQKKRKLKDSRLRAEAGLIATDSKVIAALEQREAEKLLQKNKRKRNTRSGLSDVTNTPTKIKNLSEWVKSESSEISHVVLQSQSFTVRNKVCGITGVIICIKCDVFTSTDKPGWLPVLHGPGMVIRFSR
ncbi:uncharacterized protein LOC129602316 [Paramacrobiotus metropolitanus]|uniref:uncharacterized protein LOC129602316 n=1 Tax=Paramacrobiotus metropolitanus TaxID=2943436 RepID=UPI002446261C|nr:uncharacterized protein LOC129602316 [Paramacrobiotus metropolitanus]